MPRPAPKADGKEAVRRYRHDAHRIDECRRIPVEICGADGREAEFCAAATGNGCKRARRRVTVKGVTVAPNDKRVERRCVPMYQVHCAEAGGRLVQCIDELGM